MLKCNQQGSKDVFGWWREESQGGWGGAWNVIQPASGPTSLSTNYYAWDFSVSRQGFQNKEKSFCGEWEGVWVWVYMKLFFTSQLITVRRRMSGLRENYSFQSYSRGQIIQRSQILLCGFIFFILSSCGVSLNWHVWIKETKHVKIPEPNTGDWYILWVANDLLLPTLSPLCHSLLVMEIFPWIYALLVWGWAWHLEPRSSLWRIPM